MAIDESDSDWEPKSKKRHTSSTLSIQKNKIGKHQDASSDDSDIDSEPNSRKKPPGSNKDAAVEDSNDGEESVDHRNEESDSQERNMADPMEVNGDSDSDSDAGIKEEHKLRDNKYKEIFIRRVLKSEIASPAQAPKKKDGNFRVFNKYYSCLFCKQKVQHISTHMKTHKKIPCVASQFAREKPDFEKIRNLGCDLHNRRVVEKKKGEILGLARRPDTFSVSDYGPCPHCRLWLLLSGIKRHYKKCRKDGLPCRKRDLIVQSQVLAGHINTKPSKIMLKEVFTSMKDDETGTTAKNDQMIVLLGESWLRRNIDNVEKRRHYASQRMRLSAKLLKALRAREKEESQEDQPGTEEKTMEEFLSPKYFDAFVEGSLHVSVPFMDDEEELKSPSNAIKLKYDIKRMMNCKYGIAMRQGDEEKEKECERFLKIMEIEWQEKVTKLARCVLLKRQYTVRKELPAPDDVKKISDYLNSELQHMVLHPDNFFKVVELCEALILLYNKRRTGEVEVIK